jgi:DNA-3-methyladenine glycosylase II
MASKRPGRYQQLADHSTLDIRLPAGYDARHVFDFYGRDTLCVSEQTSGSGIKKGLLLIDVPTVIDINFDESITNVRCSILSDGDLSSAMRDEAYEVCLNLLGLRLDPKHFLSFARKDPLFGPLLERRRGLRIVQSASIFEALTWAIMGQQINVAFAVSLRRTFIQQGGRRHSSGLWCYPDAKDIAEINVEQLTSRQFSKSKAETLLRLSKLIATGTIDLVLSESNTLDQISEALLNVKGIGPWTVNYALLRGYAYADCSLHGDVAVRKAIHNLTGGDARLDIAAAEQFLMQYSPHRTMAAAHLWASLSNQSF